MGALKWKVLAGKSHSGHNCVLCVLWTHCDDSGVLFVFFPWATNIFFVFFYHVLNLLDWFASLATKTFSSKPFTLLLIIYKLVNFEEHNRQHIYEKNIRPKQNTIFMWGGNYILWMCTGTISNKSQDLERQNVNKLIQLSWAWLWFVYLSFCDLGSTECIFFPQICFHFFANCLMRRVKLDGWFSLSIKPESKC